MIKENAWRPVQLGNDNALGTVDDECSRIGHEGNFPHVDFLPLYLLDDLGRRGGFAIIEDQLNQDAQRRRIMRASLLALLDIKGGFTEPVILVLQHGMTGMAGNREYRLQRGMQAFVSPLGQRHPDLQESLVGLNLGCQQIGNVENITTLAKTVTDAFLFGKRIGHFDSLSGGLYRSTERRNGLPNFICWLTSRNQRENSFAVPAQTADAFLVIQQRQKAGSFCCQP